MTQISLSQDQDVEKAEAPAAGKQVAQTKTLKTADGTEFSMSYWLYLPKDYEAQETVPLMIFMHGAGERGDDLAKVKAWGPPRLIDAGQEFPAIVVSPQCPKNKWWNPEQLKALLDAIELEYKVDANKIYATGLSMGGFGTWSLLASYPEYFAAGIPICGGGQPERAKDFFEVPVWAFHGDADSVVPVKKTNEMIEALREAGGKPKVTIYAGVDHNSWKATYENKEVFDWLFEQHRTSDKQQ
jgi:predicted peptidase